MGIRDEMPLLTRHEGEWRGAYVHVDEDGAVVDRHASHLECRFPDGGGYHQVNRYTWPDGRRERIDFPARFEADPTPRIVFDTERILGHAWEVDERTIVLTWHYRADPGNHLYEMIQLSDDSTHRARTWHWFDGGRLVRRTLISEERVSASGERAS